MSIEHIRAIKAAALLPRQPKQRKSIAKKSAKKIAQEKEEKADRKLSGGGEKERWFKARRAEMRGLCQHCGAKSSRDSDNYFRHSIAHLLPKNLFKSVATHPDNWIELCYFPPSCHSNYDHKMLDIMELNCFDEVIRKFVAIYPSIAAGERKYIPDVLLQYIEIEQ